MPSAKQSSAALLGKDGARKESALPAAFLANQFKLGRSGNPTGNRGARYGEVVALAREYGAAAVHRLVQLMESDDERIAPLAAQAILDRALGKPSPPPASEEDRIEPDEELADRRETLRALLIKGLQKEAEEKALQNC